MPKIHGVMKCYPCIRACAHVKIVLGAAQIMLAVYMLAMFPIVLDCSTTRSTCPNQFGVLLDNINNQPNGHIRNEAAVNTYCDCLTSCINYISVYHSNGQSTDPTNCYNKSQAAGPKSRVLTGNFDSDVTDQYGELPGLGDEACYSCADASRAQDSIFMVLVILTSFCGIALFISAGCEHMEVKNHNISFTICSICSDVVCALALSVALVTSVKAAHLSDSACKPLGFQAWFEEAGKDSTMGNPDHAALFTQFFNQIFEPAMTNLCRSERTLYVCSFVAGLGTFSSLWSFLASSCVVLGISDDSDSDSDDNVADHHDLLMKMQGQRIVDHRAMPQQQYGHHQMQPQMWTGRR